MAFCNYLLTLLEIFLIACIGLGPVLYLKSTQFRFYIRISVYYFIIFTVSTLSFFMVLPWPFDVQNYRTVRWLFLKATKCYRIKCEIKNREYLESDTPIVIVCNHQSSMDLIAMLWMWPNRGVALMKQSLKYMGFFGPAAALSGSIFIDRFHKDRAIEVMGKALDTVRKNNVKLWVFPEGTRNHGPGMLPFKKGAFHLAVQGQIPIVPVVFSSYKYFYNRNERRFLSSGFVKIQVLPPISTKGLGVDDVAELLEKTRERMLAVFDKISPEAEKEFQRNSTQ